MNIVPVNKQISKGMTVDQVIKEIPKFKPIAYYDKHLDAIRVQIMDCSIWEERYDSIMTIYHANHHLNPDKLNDVVGFVIKGVGHLLNEIGLDWKNGPIELANFLDEIFKLYPTSSTKRVIELYRGLHINSPTLGKVDVDLATAA